jgi:Flp pilus assembly pilin Flp
VDTTEGRHPVQKLASHLRRDDQRGQTMAEYAIVLSVITIGVLGALTAFEGPVAGGIQRVADLIAAIA